MVREEMRKKEVKRNEEVIKGWGEREREGQREEG